MKCSALVVGVPSQILNPEESIHNAHFNFGAKFNIRGLFSTDDWSDSRLRNAHDLVVYFVGFRLVHVLLLGIQCPDHPQHRMLPDRERLSQTSGKLFFDGINDAKVSPQVYSMASERIEKLLAMQQKAKAQKRKAEQQLKTVKHKISIQQNKERMHRLCERGGHLEHYLPNPELLTDQEVFLLIDYFFLLPVCASWWNR